jgi:glucokinase
MFYAGIEIGGTKLQIVLGRDGKIIDRYRFAVDQQAGAQGIRKHIRDVIQSETFKHIRGVAVGFGGPVDRSTGTIAKSYHINGWSDFSIRQWLHELSGVPVIIENDANVAAYGEALHGAGKNYNNVFYITMGSGVGAGLVVNKQIYHGALPGETEIGHIRVNKSGLIVQDTASGWAVDQKIRNASIQHPSSKLAELSKGMHGGESKILMQAINDGDDVAREIFDSTVDDFAFALSHAVHLLHPEIIVIGGGLSLIGEPLRSAIAQRIKIYLMDVFQPGPLIQLSQLKEDVVPIGALALAETIKQ